MKSELTMDAAPRQPTINALQVILLASLAIIAIALGFEYIGKYHPCPLCLMQRYAYYFAIPVAALGLVGATRGLGHNWLLGLLGLIALGFLINAGLGVYHSGVEWKWWAGPNTCTAALPNLASGGALDLSQPVIRCDAAPWTFAGLSFAGWNALLSACLAAFGLNGLLRR
jgi:disulfide bond formation protein DsbB